MDSSGRSSRSGRGGTILVVCTGNVARSPYIERRLARLLVGTDIAVSSAGTEAPEGQPMDVETARALSRHDGASANFGARHLTAELVASADLVICAAREHRARVVRLRPAALSHAFTLADLADLTQRLSPGALVRSLGDGRATAVAAVAAAAAELRGTFPPRSADQGDLSDPHGLASAAYARMADRVERELPPVAAALRHAAELHLERSGHGGGAGGVPSGQAALGHP